MAAEPRWEAGERAGLEKTKSAVRSKGRGGETSEVGRALHRARRRKHTDEALEVVLASLKAQSAHLLRPNDLVWLVDEIGLWRATGRVANALAEWLDHHGDTHRGVWEAAVAIASLDNSDRLDEALLLARPDSHRWVEHATWVASLLQHFLDPPAATGPDGGARRRPFQPLEDTEEVAEFKHLATSLDASFSELARRVLAKHGENARQGLRYARGRAIYGTPVRLLLDVWEAELA
jgi:hypothetical protein